MELKKLINIEIENFYNQTTEENRLQLGLGPLEFERNKELINRYLPPLKGTVIDVGGGPGVYSEWMAILNYDVHLIDPVATHIKQATKKAGKLKNPFRCTLGESRNLEMQDNSADLLISHGPLYHLQTKKDRIDSLMEAKRVLKPGGIMLGFAINYTASTIVSLLQGSIHEPEIYKMCKEELVSGIHNPPKNMPGMLPHAYYHRPSELKEELEEAGFEYIDTLAVEGLIWLDNNFFLTRANPQQKAGIMELLKITESDKNVLALSPHMMIAGKKI
jgi:ubiquinone/menaquinone biosynthesis C-methylase UbiE